MLIALDEVTASDLAGRLATMNPKIRTSLFRFSGLAAVHESWVTSVHERAEIQHGTCWCQKQREAGGQGSGLEVSGSAVPVPPGKSRRGRTEAHHPFQPP